MNCCLRRLSPRPPAIDGAFEREFKDDAVTFLPKPFELKALAQAVKDKLAS